MASWKWKSYNSVEHNHISVFSWFPHRFNVSSVDRLLVPANRQHLPLDKQLQQLLEKFDLTCAMKSSPSRSKRLKLLKKTINDMRNEISLKKVLPSHQHCSSTATSASTSSAPSLAGVSKPKEERPKLNGHFPDDESMYTFWLCSFFFSRCTCQYLNLWELSCWKTTVNTLQSKSTNRKSLPLSKMLQKQAIPYISVL